MITLLLRILFLQCFVYIFFFTVSEDMTCEFPNLGIQCVKKKDIVESLKVRKEIRVDPFRSNNKPKISNSLLLLNFNLFSIMSEAGFDHATQNSGSGIDLNALRLCFQVFLEGPETGEFKVPVKSVVSDPIFDKSKSNSIPMGFSRVNFNFSATESVNDLTVVKLSDCTSPVIGNKEIILLCDKISKGKPIKFGKLRLKDTDFIFLCCMKMTLK